MKLVILHLYVKDINVAIILIRIRVGIFVPEKYRAKVLLVAFDSLHLWSDSCRGSFPQTFFVQNLWDTRKYPEDIKNKPETEEGGDGAWVGREVLDSSI